MAEPLYRSIILTARGLFRTLGLRISVTGLEHLPRTGGAVLAINHTSFLDFALAGYPPDLVDHRVVRFMAKEAIFRHPVAGPLMRGMRHIPVDRAQGQAAYAEALRALKRGELLGVFPEATMSRSFDIKALKNGAARMAAVADAPLIPMIVFGGQRVLSYGHRDLTRGRPIAITIGEPMRPLVTDDVDQVTAQLRERLRALLAETVQRYPEDGTGQWWCPQRFGGTAPALDSSTTAA
jgi:1-acyl-sn-glycerol-3-phosphate acyltransferase